MAQENKCTLVEVCRDSIQLRFAPECVFAIHSKRNTDGTKDNYTRVNQQSNRTTTFITCLQTQSPLEYVGKLQIHTGSDSSQYSLLSCCYNQYINQQTRGMSNIKFTVFGIRGYWLQRDEHRALVGAWWLNWWFTHIYDEQWKARGTTIYRLLSETSRVSLAHIAGKFCLRFSWRSDSGVEL